MSEQKPGSAVARLTLLQVIAEAMTPGYDIPLSFVREQLDKRGVQWTEAALQDRLRYLEAHGQARRVGNELWRQVEPEPRP